MPASILIVDDDESIRQLLQLVAKHLPGGGAHPIG
jgi:DNA-binding NtrC family response regulator